MKHGADGAGPARDLVRFLHLTEDLRLAEHERVERRGHAEEVSNGGASGERIERVLGRARRERRELGAARFGHRFERRTGARRGDELDAVAGRNQERLADRRAAHDGAQEFGHPLGGQREALANVDGRTLVRQTPRR